MNSELVILDPELDSRFLNRYLVKSNSHNYLFFVLNRYQYEFLKNKKYKVKFPKELSIHIRYNGVIKQLHDFFINSSNKYFINIPYKNHTIKLDYIKLLGFGASIFKGKILPLFISLDAIGRIGKSDLKIISNDEKFIQSAGYFLKGYNLTTIHIRPNINGISLKKILYKCREYVGLLNLIYSRIIKKKTIFIQKHRVTEAFLRQNRNLNDVRVFKRSWILRMSDIGIINYAYQTEIQTEKILNNLPEDLKIYESLILQYSKSSIASINKLLNNLPNFFKRLSYLDPKEIIVCEHTGKFLLVRKWAKIYKRRFTFVQHGIPLNYDADWWNQIDADEINICLSKKRPLIINNIEINKIPYNTDHFKDEIHTNNRKLNKSNKSVIVAPSADFWIQNNSSFEHMFSIYRLIKLNKNYRFYIKLHGKERYRSYIFDLFEDMENVVFIDTSFFTNYVLKDFFAAITTISSFAIDAFCSGLPTIILNFDNRGTIYTNPIETTTSFDSLVNRFKELSNKDLYLNLIRDQNNFLKIFQIK